MDFRLRNSYAFVCVILLFMLGSEGLVWAEGTRTWEQSKFEDLSKGTAAGVAISSMGGLQLAPAFKSLTTTPSTYIWSIASDSSGTLFAATGAPARIYRITPDGKSTVIFEPQELGVQALVVDKSGVVFAATNPDGKVYRIEHKAGSTTAKTETGKTAPADTSWSASPVFDPKTKYIWDLALDTAGNLFVATGDHGEIFRVTPKGEHSVFFKSDEAHIRVLALDAKGDVIAGSDGSGLVYRISPTGEGFVLYSAPKKEITALAIDRAGNIYAAGAGEKRGGIPFLPTVPVAPVPSPAANPATSQQPTITLTPAQSPQPVMTAFPAPGAAVTGGSEIYRIAPDGSPTRMWTSREDLVYALAFDAHGQLLAGTGNRGRIFAISGEDQYADLLKASAGQVTAFAPGPNGGLYASTSNLGKVFSLAGTSDAQGSYESDIFDARIFSRWGRLESRTHGNVELYVRSGNVDNPDRNWSSWQKVEPQKDGIIASPAARFIQWRAVLHAGDPAPRVDSVTVNYLPKNVAPDFDDVSVQLGVRYQPLPRPANTESTGATPRFEAPPPTIHDSDSIGVKWTVRDDNEDQMVYSVYYRGDNENRWLLLKDGISDKFFSFDASLLPDGGYTIKVVASDAPSHSPGQALTSERESARFEVDTTPPRIEDLKAVAEGDQIHVTFRGVDSFSNVKRAEYSVDAGDWQFVDPADQISDSKVETYDFTVSSGGSSGPQKSGSAADAMEHVVVVRVYDRYDNMGAAKAVIRGK